MTIAREIKTLINTSLKCTRLPEQDMSSGLRRTTAPVECLIRGNKIELPADEIICIGSFGHDNTIHRDVTWGKTMHDLRVKCLDGEIRILPANSQMTIIRD